MNESVYPQLLTVRELCSVLRIRRATVSRRMAQGKIPVVRPTDGRVLVPRRYLEQFIDTAEVSA